MKYRIALLQTFDDRDPLEVRHWMAASELEAQAKVDLLEHELEKHRQHAPEDRHVIDVRPVASA